MKKIILILVSLIISSNVYSDILYRGIKRKRPKEKVSEEIVNYALIIGISDYANFEILKTAGEDAVEIAEALKKEKYIVKLLNEATDIIDNKSQILQEINELSTLGKNTRVLIYFAGHGYLDEEGQKGYFVPRTSEVDKPDQYLSYEQILDSVENYNSRQVMVFITSA